MTITLKKLYEQDQEYYLRNSLREYPKSAVDYVCEHISELVDQAEKESEYKLNVIAFKVWLRDWIKERLTFNVHK